MLYLEHEDSGRRFRLTAIPYGVVLELCACPERSSVADAQGGSNRVTGPRDRRIRNPARSLAAGFLLRCMPGRDNSGRRDLGLSPLGVKPTVPHRAPAQRCGPVQRLSFQNLWAMAVGTAPILARSGFMRVRFPHRPPCGHISMAENRVANARMRVRFPLAAPFSMGVGSGERVSLISSRDRPDGLERVGSIPTAPTV